MLTPLRLAVTVISTALALALAGPSRPLAAQIPMTAYSKPLSTPVASPEVRSLEWLLGKPRLDGLEADPIPPLACSLQQCDAAVACFPGTNSACLLQTFLDIQWRICVQASAYGDAANQHSRGISIGPVDVRRNLATTTPWQRVIYRAEVAENSTPYHAGEAHLSDDQYADWTNWRRTVTEADANGGALITLAHDASFGPSIVAECLHRFLPSQASPGAHRVTPLVERTVRRCGNCNTNGTSNAIPFGSRDDC